jgi:hypothetical protein
MAVAARDASSWAVDGGGGSGGLVAIATPGRLGSGRALIQDSAISRRVAVAMESIATAARSGANPLNGRSTEVIAATSKQAQIVGPPGECVNPRFSASGP